MKIQNILVNLTERAQFVPTTYAYHATDMKYLRSILKQGLLPNKNDNGYGSSEVSSSFGYKLSPLPGVYFTDDQRHAEHIAKQIDGQGLIIIAKVQKRTASMDEDRLTSDIIDEPALISSIRKNEATIKADPQKYVNNVVDNIIQYKLPHDISPKLIQSVKPELTKYVDLLVKNQATEEHGDWSSDQWNAAVKASQIELTKKFKNILHRPDVNQDTFKVDGPVGFSGANKIVGLYNFISGVGWGDLGPFERDAYHKVKQPMELVKS